MLMALNILMLGISSGILGLWMRAFLLDLGIIQGFEAGLWACAVIAAFYAASQLLFRTFLMLLKPTRAVSVDVSEIGAYVSAVVLVPSLLGFRFNLPYASLKPLEPLIHLGVFGALFATFRLMTFFAAVSGEKAGRGVLLRWALSAALAGLLVPASAWYYLDAVNQKQALIQGEAVAFAVDNTYASAFAIPENRRVIVPLDRGNGDQFCLLCAPRPDEAEFPDIVFVSIAAYNRDISPASDMETLKATLQITRSVALADEGWTTLPVGYVDLPPDTVCITLSWSEADPQSWRRRLGILPKDDLGRTLMVSGPWEQHLTRLGGPPGVVVVLLEGMGAENMGLYGYDRNTTPKLARHAADMVMFEEAYTPTPDARGAAMSLLTGLNPLIHGYYESAVGPLPKNVCTLAEVLREQGYFTVAFTEGRGLVERDLVFGSGFEKGFILFDDYFPVELRSLQDAGDGSPTPLAPAGARITLNKAGDWIEKNAEVQFFVFIRVRELSEPRYRTRYGAGFMKRTGNSAPVDVYDTAVAYVDRQLGLFLDRLDCLPEEQKPVVVIASTNGFDFREPGRGAWRKRGEARRTLAESVLRVPLLLRVPGQTAQTNKTPASLVDVAPTLAALAGTALPHPNEGANMLAGVPAREIVSVMGNPVAQSVRSGRWRFTWQTGLDYDSLERIEKETVLEFIDVARYRENEIVQDNVRREPQLVEAFKTQLNTALQDVHFDNALLTMTSRKPGPVASEIK